MSDIDLMSETQVALMAVTAVALWVGLAWTLYRRNRPRKTRRTYRDYRGLAVDLTLGVPTKRELRRRAREAKRLLGIAEK